MVISKDVEIVLISLVGSGVGQIADPDQCGAEGSSEKEPGLMDTSS
jgi:hypothetical protein